MISRKASWKKNSRTVRIQAQRGRKASVGFQEGEEKRKKKNSQHREKASWPLLDCSWIFFSDTAIPASCSPPRASSKPRCEEEAKDDDDARSLPSCIIGQIRQRIIGSRCTLSITLSSLKVHWYLAATIPSLAMQLGNDG